MLREGAPAKLEENQIRSRCFATNDDGYSDLNATTGSTLVARRAGM